MIKDAAIQGEGYFGGRQQARRAPDRDRPRPRLRLRGGGHPRGRGRRPRPRRARDRDRAARSRSGNIFKLGTRYSEPLGATYLDEEGSGAPDRDGQLRDRPGPHRRRGDRAGRRRARDRVAAVDRAVAGPPRRARQGRRRGRRGGGADLRAAARGRRRGRATTTATRGRARSSPTPSCSAARCGSPSAPGRSPRERSRRRCARSGAEERLPAIAHAAAAARAARAIGVGRRRR